jgi:hypothetical protein
MKHLEELKPTVPLVEMIIMDVVAIPVMPPVSRIRVSIVKISAVV